MCWQQVELLLDTVCVAVYSEMAVAVPLACLSGLCLPVVCGWVDSVRLRGTMSPDRLTVPTLLSHSTQKSRQEVGMRKPWGRNPNDECVCERPGRLAKYSGDAPCSKLTCLESGFSQ